ncbi:hypothetical protein BpHYR1_046663 [Brachionus plicatilis]|uniref:Uncharacterized protein n=1 Tax=Brachionus plicatilis TaxID=10195 RepID=A0A3M7RVP7_BRAPC|nr:hypothetical protein BpHYR1_046663 [Brachionus plicatilis]
MKLTVVSIEALVKVTRITDKKTTNCKNLEFFDPFGFYGILLNGMNQIKSNLSNQIKSKSTILNIKSINTYDYVDKVIGWGHKKRIFVRSSQVTDFKMWPMVTYACTGN